MFIITLNIKLGSLKSYMRKYGIHNITILANNRLLAVAFRRLVRNNGQLAKTIVKYEISSHSTL
jgi:hypothetical protein